MRVCMYSGWRRWYFKLLELDKLCTFEFYEAIPQEQNPCCPSNLIISHNVAKLLPHISDAFQDRIPSLSTPELCFLKEIPEHTCKGLIIMLLPDAGITTGGLLDIAVEAITAEIEILTCCMWFK